MRTFKLIGALALALAASAIGVASASAALLLWSWNPGSAKETFTGKSGKATLELDPAKTGVIVCTKSLTLLPGSELLENKAKLATAAIHFEGCKAEGIAPVNSVGDTKEIILTTVKLHNCMIKPGDFGILFEPLERHIEIPLTKELILVKGSFVGLISPLTGSKLHYELLIQQAGGLQVIPGCEDTTTHETVKENLKCIKNAEPAVECGEGVLEGLLLFDGTIDKAGEEMLDV